MRLRLQKLLFFEINPPKRLHQTPKTMTVTTCYFDEFEKQWFYKLCLKEAILDFGGLTTLISQDTF